MLTDTPLSVADVLERAADLIEPEGAWTQEVAAKNARGEQVEPSAPDAVCWCTLGIIGKIMKRDWCAMDAAKDYLRLATDEDWIADWNDRPERTQPEVVAALRHAATLARAEVQA